jgi:hypothetical protein
MNEGRIVSDGCGICVVLNALRLEAIINGDCAALDKATEMLALHWFEHQQRAFSAALAEAQAQMSVPLRGW